MKECCKEKHIFPSHAKELPKLNRIIGQLEGIKRMIESERYCLDILIQLAAVRRALQSSQSNILERHLDSCVAQAFTSPKEKKQKIDEVLYLFKKM